MNFKIGDKVKFLNEKGEGCITKIINKTTVNVSIEDGFEIPYSASQLIKIENNNSPELDKIKPEVTLTISETNEKIEISIRGIEGIYLAIVPENEDILNCNLNFWLINTTSYSILFTFSSVENEKYRTIEASNVESFENFLLSKVERKTSDEFLNTKFDIIFFDFNNHLQLFPISKNIKIKAIKLCKENSFVENNLISEKAIIATIYERNDLQNDLKLKEKADKLLVRKKSFYDSMANSKPHKKNNPDYEMEIDIHIEELIENYEKLSNSEIINIQLQHFQEALDKAIKEHFRKLTVIHGVGNGILKSKVRAILEEYNNLKFYDAPISKYGFGATEIDFGL